MSDGSHRELCLDARASRRSHHRSAPGRDTTKKFGSRERLCRGRLPGSSPQCSRSERPSTTDHVEVRQEVRRLEAGGDDEHVDVVFEIVGVHQPGLRDRLDGARISSTFSRSSTWIRSSRTSTLAPIGIGGRNRFARSAVSNERSMYAWAAASPRVCGLLTGPVRTTAPQVLLDQAQRLQPARPANATARCVPPALPA